ncbi:MAG: TlpA family protein disulfide reductase [Clostridia bacterium]|nr:TlpA family protein disulfide reductase [Clostridia bacterium]MBR4359385.1 TlpA family protein disulfide reductase [Clostridia bacterium]
MKRAPLMLLLTLVLSLCLTAAGSAETQQDLIGTQMPDFTVTAIDGETYTFSEVLLEKELVLINIFATWCPPCAMEFPAMEEAYQQYQDKVAIIALSLEPTDDAETLAAYAEEHGMTFIVGSDIKTNLAYYFMVQAIPTSVLVDRTGTIVYIGVGAVPTADGFVQLFRSFIGE